MVSLGRLSALLFLSLSLCTLGYAGPVDSLSALRAARERLGMGRATRGGGQPELVMRHMNANGGVDAWLYNAPAGEAGFAIVAGDDALPEILGYSESGRLDASQLPEQLVAYLANASEALAGVKAGTLRMNATRASGYTKAVKPLLAGMRWGQDAPFNAKTPSQMPVGCVATAVAQVMRFHCWPAAGAKGTGKYTANGYEKSVSLEGHKYDWKLMPKDCSGNLSTQAKDAVAQLSFDAGVAAGMKYGPSSTGGSASNLGAASRGLVGNFGYSDGMYNLERDYFTWGEWEHLLQVELQEGRPVLYGGQSPGGGHAFVIDGYDGNGMYHFNWGWNGMGDGYFTLVECDPETQGTGAGSGGGYVGSTGMLVGVQPSELPYSKELEKMGACVYMQGLNFNDYYSGKNLTLQTSVGNAALRAVTVEVAFAAYSEDGSKMLKVGEAVKMTIPGGNFTANQFTLPTGSMGDGTYRLLPVWRPAGSNAEWQPVRTPMRGPRYLVATVTGNQMSMKKESESRIPKMSAKLVESKLYGNKTGLVRVRFTNEGTQDYNGFVGIGQSNNQTSAPYTTGTSTPIILPPKHSYDYEHYYATPITSSHIVFVYDKANSGVKGSAKDVLGSMMVQGSGTAPAAATKSTMTAQFVTKSPLTIKQGEATTIQVKVTIQNGGVYSGPLSIFFFKKESTQSSNGIRQQVYVQGTQVVDFPFNGSLAPGVWNAFIYATLGGISEQLTKGNGDYLALTVQEASTSSTTTSEASLPILTYKDGVVYENGVARTKGTYQGPTTTPGGKEGPEEANAVGSQILESARIAPNPIGDQLRVLDCGGTVRYEVYTLSGVRIMAGGHDGAPTLEVNATSLPSGIYLLRLVTPEGARTLPLLKH